MKNYSRRAWLRAAANLAATAGPLGGAASTPLALSLFGLGSLAAQSSHAADASGYRATVCLFMAGGNDSHNWVVPTDATGYAQYAAVRRELAWPQGGLLPLTSSSQAPGRSFGMPQELQALNNWYEAGRCAIVANVGPLERPITKAEYLAGIDLPSKLFSHNDQQSAWQSLSAEGAPSGWGGRFGDVLMSANAYPVFTAVSAAGNAVFLSGETVTQYQVGQNGPVSVNALASSALNGSGMAPAALRRVLGQSGSTDFQREYTRVLKRGLESAATLQAALGRTSTPALPSTPMALPNGSTLSLAADPLATQLRTVARMMAAGPLLGMKRQVFMVSMGGFDTHANQMRDQPLLMARVANAVDWFLQALAAAGQLDDVLLFTASDFGRTLASNGAGCDHGWGSHHFVAGGTVKGREIYGRMPITALNTADEVGSGRLLPSTSVTELAATIGQWMGAGANDLDLVLPGLGNFDRRSLGFV